jgi:outer membrane immunogenic protein
MKKFLLSTVGLVALGMASAPASAADLAARPVYTKAPPPIAAPYYDWSGFYLGINGGWGQNRDNRSDATTGVSFGSHDANGGTVGGQVGYRWQMSSLVFGLEAQGNWSDFKGSSTSLLFNGQTNTSKIDSFGLFTGQIGYAWDRVLVYVKGGAAVTDNHYTANSTIGPLIGFDATSETRWGASVGVGIEYAFAQNWSLGFEYNHLFMGNPDVNSSTGFLIADHIKEDVDLFTARVNYKFGGPVVARY